MLDAALIEPLNRIADFAQAADLPGDLVDGYPRLLAPAERVAHALGKQNHRVMIGAVAREITVGIAETRYLRRLFGAARVIDHVGDAKAKQVDVKMNARFHVAQIETEMTEPANFEGLV